jgi:hypothetical protein
MHFPIGDFAISAELTLHRNAIRSQHNHLQHMVIPASTGMTMLTALEVIS